MLYIIIVAILIFIAFQFFIFNKSKKAELEKKEKQETLKDLFPNLYSRRSGLMTEVEKYHYEKEWLEDEAGEIIVKILENESDELKKQKMLEVIKHLEQDWNELSEEIKKKNVTKQEMEFLSRKFWKDHVWHFKNDIFYFAVPTLQLEEIIEAIGNIPNTK